MSGDPNQTYVRKPVCQTTFFVALDETEEEARNTQKAGPPPDPRPVRTGLWIDLGDDGSENENKAQPKKSRRSSRSKQGLDWVPLKENFVNTPISSENIQFSVPQRLPPKLKKKLTPIKVTPRRRSSGMNSSLRRETFRVTPRSSSHIKMLPKSMTTTKKRRSGSGASTPLMKTPRNRPLLDVSVSSGSTTFTFLGVEEIQYISWLNVMLSSKGDEKNDKIDSNQLIIDCFNTEKTDPSLCPSKEVLSAEAYRESLKWNQLRTSAICMYKSEAVTTINKKLFDNIRNEKFLIRKDRAVHADIGYRKHISELLLSYNFLWLRIGLETVFQQKIPISSGTMHSNLLTFIQQNLLESKQLMNKYCPKAVKHYFKDDVHISETKKYILANFLLLVNFLDYAKQNRLIEHNPCLFRIRSNHKSTQEVIRSFASEFITGVGDIIKYLKVSVGFSMNYNQTAIEEFDFEVNNLAQDLKCGLRLARLAELTTENKDLLSKLLYPATNTTRKIHNLKLALDAFGDVVPLGITAQDIQKGNRTKTIKLLDAIIFKHKTDQILKEEKLLEECVIIIQQRFRAYKQMIIERRRFQSLKQLIILIQRRFRANRLTAPEQNNFKAIRRSAIFIQRRFRAHRLMAIEKDKFQALKRSAICIQRRFRANRLMTTEKKYFQALKRSAICIQRRYRANQLMVAEHNNFLAIKRSAIFIQRRFRANRLMAAEQNNFKAIKRSAILIQRRFRAKQLMIAEKNNFEAIKRSAILIQRRFRAKQLMVAEQNRFRAIKRSAIFIQRRFRANRLMAAEQKNFRAIKRSAILIQRRFRANQLMVAEKNSFRAIKRSVIFVQRRFRANRLMAAEQKNFRAIKRSAILVQRLFRAKQMMIADRNNFQAIKRSAIFIQRRFRSQKLMAAQQKNFRAIIRSAIFIQRRFRANRLMAAEHNIFLVIKRSTICIQRRFRAKRLMIAEQNNFQAIKRSAIFIQRRFRANRLMAAEHNIFLVIKRSTICIQRRYRANRLMAAEQKYFLAIKRSAIFIQRRFRANRLMAAEQNNYKAIKRSAIFIQRRFRAKRLMIAEQNRFQAIKRSAIFIQRRFRANSLMAAERNKFQTIRRSAICIQRRYRAKRLMVAEQNYFQVLRRSAIYIQRRFRANRLLAAEHNYFQLRIKAAIKIQSLWKGYKIRKHIHEENQKVKTAFSRIKSSTAMVSEDMRLCNRTFYSLQNLLAYDQLLPLAYDLDSLDSTTSLLPDTCETIANAGAVPILLKILNEPNRSEPHKQIFTMALNILLNLAKYEQTLPNLTCNSKTIETLFRIVKKFNRHIVLIEKSFTLLWILLKDESILQYVKSDKRKLETIKQISEHWKKDKSYKKYKLKSDYNFAPKWQIGRRNVYEFTNHFVAIQAITSRLDVK